MAWYDAQVPAWIRPAVVTPTEGGNAFAQGVELGIHQQQLQIQKEHYALERLAYSQRLEAVREANVLRAEKQAAEDAIRLRTERGYSELAKHVATVGSYADGWNNPEFTRKFWDISSQYPDLMLDPRFHYLSGGFDRAATIQARKDASENTLDFKERMAEFAQEGRETVEEMRGRQARELEVERQGGRMELEETRQRHRVETLEANARLKANTFLTDRMQLAAFHAKLDATLRNWRMKRAKPQVQAEAIDTVLRQFGLSPSGTPLEPEPPGAATPEFLPTDSSPATAAPAAPAPAPVPLSKEFEEWLKRRKK